MLFCLPPTKSSCFFFFHPAPLSPSSPLPLWCYPGGGEIEQWTSTVRRTLRYGIPPPMTTESKKFRQLLLLEDDQDPFDDDEDDYDEYDNDNNSSTLIFKGIPRRPLYKELAYRLYRWSRWQQAATITTSCKNKNNNNTTTTTNDKKEPNNNNNGLLQLLLPAEQLGLQEILDQFCTTTNNLSSSSQPPQTVNDIHDWLLHAGEYGILRLLGMRCTIGSIDSFQRRLLLPASRTALLEAANQRHHPNMKLTVAARARSKHAHRYQGGGGDGQEDGGDGGGGYFGIVKGSQESQNDETNKILIQLIENAVWINIHTFGGRTETDDPVLELRVAEGYGARWTADWSSYYCSSTTTTTTNNQQRQRQRPERIQFRGFLEPQMEDGHEKRWRH